MLKSGGSIHWTMADGNPTTANGLNRLPNYAAQDVRLAVYNEQLYAAWTERNTNAGNPYQIRVAVYNGDRTWSFVDGNGVNGLNANSAVSAFKPCLGVYTGSLYITWSETNGTETRIRVMKYNGASVWAFVDGGNVGDGINYSANASGYNANSPQFFEYGTNMYVTWQEYNGTATQIRARYYNGTNWLWADSGSPDGINFNPGQSGQYPQLAYFNGNLFFSWQELSGTGYQIRLKYYNGTVWNAADGGAGTGINLNTAQNAGQVQLVVYNSKLYALWEETNGSVVQQVRCAVYNGGISWTSLSMDSNCGINRNCTKNAQRPVAAAFNGLMYTAWYEPNNYGFNQIRVVQYNGNDANPSGSFVENKADPEYGLNYNPSQNAAYPQLVECNGKLYIAWYENNGTANQIRVAEGTWY